MNSLKLNGKQQDVDVPGDTPVLWVLRDTLGMTGTKYGCGIAVCGACTVHVDGHQRRSCVTPVSSISGAGLATIEAIGNDPIGRAVQDAWVRHDVVQCGYCQSGQIMSAVALLKANKHPTDADIDRAMSANLCRCGTYFRVHAALKDAARAIAKPKGSVVRFMRPSPPGGIDRRSFLKVGVGSGFALGAYPADAQTVAAGGALKAHEIPSAFVSIGADGVVTVTIGKVDIGQGVHTALPMLVAEEMDADWTKVRCAFGPAGEAYKDPIQQAQVVGGSTSMKDSWVQYREIGARMRAMLVAAASKRFGLAAPQLTTEAGVVIAPDGRRAGYGELAAAAFAEPVPASVQLKSPQRFKLIGKPTGRLDALDKSTGRQQFGIDVGLPGMRTVLILHPPVFGAKVERFDATLAKAVAGVEDVYQVPLVSGTGLAVVAEGFWPAHKARELLRVEWDTRGVEKVDSDRCWRAIVNWPCNPERRRGQPTRRVWAGRRARSWPSTRFRTWRTRPWSR